MNHRKFSWWNTQWSFAGVRDPKQPSPAVAPGYDDGKWVFTGSTAAVSGQRKEIPDLPITVMAEATATLNVGAPGSATRPYRPSKLRHCGGAGTTTASACCCRAT